MKPTTLELDLQRNWQLSDRTIGDLSVDGKFLCNTLEDTERLFPRLGKIFGTKIFGKTAIPLGRYELVLTHSPRFKTILPRLLNVPQFDGALIHKGNKPEDTHGCILVGKYDTKTKTLAGGTSTPAFKKLMSILEPASKTGKIYITVR